MFENLKTRNQCSAAGNCLCFRARTHWKIIVKAATAPKTQIYWASSVRNYLSAKVTGSQNLLLAC